MTAGRGSRLTLLPLILMPVLVALPAAPPEVHPTTAIPVAAAAALATLLLLGARPVPPRGAVLGLLLLLPPLVVSHRFAVDGGASTETLARFGVALALFAAGAALGTSGAVGLLRLLSAAGGAIGLYALWQVAFGFQALLSIENLPLAAVERLATGRVFATFPIPAACASFLLLALPVAMAATIHENRRAHRVLHALCALLAVAALLLTRSQGAFLALGLTFALWAWSRHGRPRWAAPGAAGALVLLALVVVLRGGVALDDAASGGPVALRWRNFATALRMTADAPLTGVGGGGFASVYTEYRRAGDNETRFVHSAPLQLIAEHGLGMIAPLLFIAAGARRTVGVLRRRGAPLAAAAAFGLTALTLHNLWDFPILLPSLLWTAALLGGVLRGLAARAAGTRRAAPVPWPGAWLGRALPAAAIFAAVIITAMTSLARETMFHAAAAVAASQPGAARELAARAARQAPWLAEPHLLIAETLLREGGVRDESRDHPQAAGAAAAATARNRAWPAAHRARGLAAAGAGDPGTAALELQVAARLHPRSPVYRDDLAALARGLRPSGSPSDPPAGQGR